MGLSRHLVQCSFQTNEVTLKQTERFKYLGVRFSSDRRQDNELNTRTGEASAVLCQLYRSVILKRELCTKAKLSVFRKVFVLILIYGYECWVLSNDRKSEIRLKAVRKVRGLSLLDKVKSTYIC